MAAARLGCSVALITMDAGAIGRMSCNPAIGGTAKGHLVREIDALGGEMGRIADATGIHFRMLNKSKGPAVWSPRCQNDREWYARVARETVTNQVGLSVVEDSLVDLFIHQRRVSGAQLESGRTILCGAVVVCSGTFLNAHMYTGKICTMGGRFGERPSTVLSDRLMGLGILSGRLKTGTPPRVRLGSVDFASTEVQHPDEPAQPFSHRTGKIRNRQIPMYLTYTNSETHRILREGFSESPMFTGRIKGTGPRYCPSIEDKVARFAGRDRHQIFLEPEGYNSDIVYVNGFSTSLPAVIQERAIRTIPGLERCEIIRPGYAVEYDYFPPIQLSHSLESKQVRGLFFAGQVNGTSGYEEAAAQGFIAGVNAVRALRRQEPFVLSRSEAYIGVMIDDLVSKGTDEPYRIFTSRAEFRLLLRQDNADSRLMRKGHKLGLVVWDQIEGLDSKEHMVKRGIATLRNTTFSSPSSRRLLESIGATPTDGAVSMEQLLRRPEVDARVLVEFAVREGYGELGFLLENQEVLDRIGIEVKYAGYIARQEEEVRLLRRREAESIPANFDYASVKGLSTEGKERLSLIRPVSIGQAVRLSGVTHADLAVLMVALRT